MRVLVTGSSGLIGSALMGGLADAGIEAVGYDLRRSLEEDILNTNRLDQALTDVDGVVHLAAISRVVIGQLNPARCVAVNVRALATLLALMQDKKTKPWIIFGSSREVYGEAETLPARETAPLKPLNTYAQTKVDGENMVFAARTGGLTANVCRFSTVYGSVDDHADRLVPAFARAAALGGTLRVEGGSNMVDTTYIGDIVDGLLRLIWRTAVGDDLPPIHFVSGSGVRIDELAKLAQRTSSHQLRVEQSTPRSYDVSKFIGEPSFCAETLGWRATTPLDVGFRALVRDFAATAASGVTSSEGRVPLLRVPELI